MNDSNRISSLLHALLFGSALLVSQRVALAQDAAPAKARLCLHCVRPRSLTVICNDIGSPEDLEAAFTG